MSAWLAGIGKALRFRGANSSSLSHSPSAWERYGCGLLLPLDSLYISFITIREHYAAPPSGIYLISNRTELRVSSEPGTFLRQPCLLCCSERYGMRRLKVQAALPEEGRCSGLRTAYTKACQEKGGKLIAAQRLVMNPLKRQSQCAGGSHPVSWALLNPFRQL